MSHAKLLGVGGGILVATAIATLLWGLPIGLSTPGGTPQATAKSESARPELSDASRRAGDDNPDDTPEPTVLARDRLGPLANCVAPNGTTRSPPKVLLSSRLRVSGASFVLPRGCEVTLAHGAHLVLDAVEVRTKNFIVRGNARETAELTIHDSIIEGVDAGLLVDMEGADVHVAIRRSRLAFDRGIWIRLAVTETKPTERGTAPTVNIQDSELVSADEDGDGIAIAGSEHQSQLNLKRVTIRDGSGSPFIFGHTCYIQELHGGQALCRSYLQRDPTDEEG